ncbi:hypothetical protein AB0M02_13320 [Actinoplanes sp. NPDC051861]|uniref:hypothetical protein n=1 Tax=Actinoplanes sp. NPDC051861 TaxID=3155170 RepID=UPI003434D9B4
MTDPQDDIRPAPEVEATGPEYDEAGDLNYDESHGAGEHLDVPAALQEEAERARSLSR